MKKIIILTIYLITGFNFSIVLAQQNVFMQQLPLLSETELEIIENNQPPRIKIEAASRTPGQYSIAVLSGNNSTNKQNTARYLAQKTGAPIYKINLWLVINENVEVTKRNLKQIFEAAKDKQSILFFDEADALFSKRKSINDAHTRYDDAATNYFIYLEQQYHGVYIISVTASAHINPLIFKKYVRFHIQ